VKESLHLFVVSLDANFAKLVETGADTLRLAIDTRADLAMKQILQSVEQVSVDYFITVDTVCWQNTGRRYVEEKASYTESRCQTPRIWFKTYQ
jgi:hypothetical protein